MVSGLGEHKEHLMLLIIICANENTINYKNKFRFLTFTTMFGVDFISTKIICTELFISCIIIKEKKCKTLYRNGSAGM